MAKERVVPGMVYDAPFTEEEMVDLEAAAKATGKSVEEFVKEASINTARQLAGIPRVTIKGIERKE